MIYVFSYNRYSHLKLCVDFLRGTITKDTEIFIFDDGSDDPAILQYLRHPFLQPIFQPINVDQETVRYRASRIGLQRKRALEHFMKKRGEPYAIFLDDDIITTENALDDIVSDFKYLRQTDFARPGLMTMHALVKPVATITIDGKIFCRYTFSGEANLVLSRSVVEDVGCHFGAGPKEFADIQIARTLAAGYCYYSRVHPYYPVQHLGFGSNGSVVHKAQRKPPPWNVEPYRTSWKYAESKYLQVPGFDLNRYIDCVKQVGGSLAPKEYMTGGSSGS